MHNGRIHRLGLSDGRWDGREIGATGVGQLQRHAGLLRHFEVGGGRGAKERHEPGSGVRVRAWGLDVGWQLERRRREGDGSLVVEGGELVVGGGVREVVGLVLVVERR